MSSHACGCVKWFASVMELRQGSRERTQVEIEEHSKAIVMAIFTEGEGCELGDKRRAAIGTRQSEESRRIIRTATARGGMDSKLKFGTGGAAETRPSCQPFYHRNGLAKDGLVSRSYDTSIDKAGSATARFVGGAVFIFELPIEPMIDELMTNES